MRDLAVSKLIIDDLQKRFGCSDLFDWLDLQAEHLAVFGTDQTTHGVKLTKQIFAARSVIGVEQRSALNQEACILPVAGGFKIQYRQGLPRARRRFAIAHELGHTFFFREPGSSRAESKLQGAEEPTIEVLCDFFAGALLLPRRRFLDKIESLGWDGYQQGIPPLHLVPMLAQEFAVAPQAVARRMVFDIFASHRIVFCVKRNVDEPMEPWHTVWYAASAASHNRMPTGWRIALDSHGRKLPPELIPDTPKGETRKAMIDGRLHVAASPQAPTESRRPISKRSTLPSKSALVAHCLTDPDFFRSQAELVFIAIQ